MTPASKVPTVWFRWLLMATVGVMAFGLSMVVMPDMVRRLFGWLIYSSADFFANVFEPGAVAYITLAHGVLGAVMFGWGLALLLVLLGPFRRGSREGWLIVAISLAAWWLPDTWFSLQTGFWQNAVLNVVVAALFAVPLVATRQMLRAAA